MNRPLILHPFLFAAYAVLGVYSTNAAEVHIRWIVRPLLFTLLAGVIIYWILQLVSKDRLRAGYLTTLILLWIFFGHIYRLLYDVGQFSTSPWRGMLALLVWTALLSLLGSKRVWHHIKEPDKFSNYLNVIFFFVNLFPLSITIFFWWQTAQQVQIVKVRQDNHKPTVLHTNSTPPDIYLIILDAYGRDDFLNKVYGCDNSDFSDFLSERGFYVASQSSTNYPQTQLSLTSSLYMSYLDDLTYGLEESSNRAPLYQIFQTNDVMRSLSDAGYKVIGLPSVILFTRLNEADIYYPLDSINLNNFEGLILSTTVADLLIQNGAFDTLIPSFNTHRNYILYELDKLKTVSQISGPKFIFAHLMIPHPPFVFDQFGNPIQPNYPYTLGDASGFPGTESEYITGYSGQITFANHALMEVIDAILDGSDRPPIIIIQGDHGPGAFFTDKLSSQGCLWERYSILNAYYFPDHQYDSLYPSVTPVNTFRIIFNQYFGTDLPILKDKNYYASWQTPYKYTEITGSALSSCEH